MDDIRKVINFVHRYLRMFDMSFKLRIKQSSIITVFGRLCSKVLLKC